MEGLPNDDLFAGLPQAVEQALRISNFKSKTAALTLSRMELGPQARTLVRAVLECIDRNWSKALAKPHGWSTENFRWERPQTYIGTANGSPEVSFERALISALVAARRTDWSNQVPLISGLFGPHAYKRLAVDLVQESGGCFEFVELKIDSNTPLAAAIEVLIYGLLWLLARRDRTLIRSDSPILDTAALRLSVLAPQQYYSRYRMSALAEVINDGLRAVGRTHDISMDFRFTAFPVSFDWTSKTLAALDRPDPVALLDSRKDL